VVEHMFSAWLARALASFGGGGAGCDSVRLGSGGPVGVLCCVCQSLAAFLRPKAQPLYMYYVGARLVAARFSTARRLSVDRPRVHSPLCPTGFPSHFAASVNPGCFVQGYFVFSKCRIVHRHGVYAYVLRFCWVYISRYLHTNASCGEALRLFLSFALHPVWLGCGLGDTHYVSTHQVSATCLDARSVTVCASRCVHKDVLQHAWITALATAYRTSRL
jgi:hypothetical protein